MRRVKQREVVCGLFGLDYSVTKRMMNKLLKTHGLRLKVRRTGHGDESAVEIVKFGGDLS